MVPQDPERAIDGNQLAYAAALGNRERVAQLLATIPPKVRAENIAPQQARSPSLAQNIQDYFQGLLNAVFSPAQQANFLDINRQDAALHWAVAQGHVDIVRLLLKYDANLRLTNNQGLTALQLVQRNRQEAIMREDIPAVRRLPRCR